jgi:hypothetical protein
MSGTETTMPKRKKPRNSFSAALDAAAKRYAQATKERDAAVQKLDALNQELPALQQTITALQKQLGKDAHIPGPVERDTFNAAGKALGLTPVSPLPPELAKLVGPQDLSNMGSVPPTAPTPQRELTEDEIFDLGDVK